MDVVGLCCPTARIKHCDLIHLVPMLFSCSHENVNIPKILNICTVARMTRMAHMTRMARTLARMAR